MIILGLMGYGGSGKDEVADALKWRGYRHLKFAYNLVRSLKELDPIVAVEEGREVRVMEVLQRFGYTEAKRRYPELRRLLQKKGEGDRETHGDRCWITLVEREVAETQEPNVVISDVRYKNEADWIRARGGYLVRVVRPGVGPVNDHVSEHDLEGYAADWVISNDGDLEGLRRQASAVAGRIG